MNVSQIAFAAAIALAAIPAASAGSGKTKPDSKFPNLSIVYAERCGGAGGVFAAVHNSSPNTGYRVTVRVDSSPNPGTYPQDMHGYAPPGGEYQLGCTIDGGPGIPFQRYKFQITGAAPG